MTTFTTIFRTGGTTNFKWQRAAVSPTREAAQEQAESVRRMGYPAVVHETARLDAIGLPETFEA